MLKVKGDKITFEGDVDEGGIIHAREIDLFRSGRDVLVSAGFYHKNAKLQLVGSVFKFTNRQSAKTRAKLVKKAVRCIAIKGDTAAEEDVYDFIYDGVKEMLSYPPAKKRKKS